MDRDGAQEQERAADSRYSDNKQAKKRKKSECYEKSKKDTYSDSKFSSTVGSV